MCFVLQKSLHSLILLFNLKMCWNTNIFNVVVLWVGVLKVPLSLSRVSPTQLHLKQKHFTSNVKYQAKWTKEVTTPVNCRHFCFSKDNKRFKAISLSQDTNVFPIRYIITGVSLKGVMPRHHHGYLFHYTRSWSLNKGRLHESNSITKCVRKRKVRKETPTMSVECSAVFCSPWTHTKHIEVEL